MPDSAHPSPPAKAQSVALSRSEDKLPTPSDTSSTAPARLEHSSRDLGQAHTRTQATDIDTPSSIVNRLESVYSTTSTSRLQTNPSTGASFTAKRLHSISARSTARTTTASAPLDPNKAIDSSRQGQAKSPRSGWKQHQRPTTRQSFTTTIGSKRSYAQSTCSNSRSDAPRTQSQSPFVSREPSVDSVHKSGQDGSMKDISTRATRKRKVCSTNTRNMSSEQTSTGSPPLFPDMHDIAESYWTEPSQHGSNQHQIGLPSVGMESSVENSLGPEIIMALNVKGRKVGCSYYDGHLLKLFVLQDMAECNVVDMIETVKAQVRPTLILVSTRMDEDILSVLRFEETGQETKVEIRPSSDFSYATAKSKVIAVTINAQRSRHDSASRGPHHTMARPHCSEMDDCVQKDAQLRLSIDLQSTESVGCAGAVISFLSRYVVSRSSVRVASSLMIVAIESFTMESFMFINPNSLSSLQIFEDESHPNMHSSVRGRKEGLSLFGVLNRTKTSQGRYLLRQWLLRPSLDLNVIHSRHQSVECFVRTENQPTVGQLTSCLSHVKNIPRVLQELPRKATLAEWQAILQFAYYSLKIYNSSQELLVGESPIIQQIKQQFIVKDLMDIGAYINDVVDFDESIIEGRCVVKYNVDEELDRMRQTYHGLDSFLSEIAKDISQTIPSDFTSTINVIYFPQLGYLITVPMNPSWKTDQDFHLEGLSYQFSTESTVYYKSNAMRELDEHLGDIHGLIVDREIDILQGLQERILEYAQLLVICSDLCAELDVLTSLAQVARLRNFRRPLMTEQRIIHVIGGRHPLQELVVDSFVTNDTLLGDAETPSSVAAIASSIGKTGDQQLSDPAVEEPQVERLQHDNEVMILSGPNSSGKSVYLKQVALITYMAHVGSFVPATTAVIGLTDKILTRVQTRETVSSIQSSFMTDLQQVVLALKMATKRSLVVLDEFGKGTTSIDGAGMFCGVIEYFARMEHDRPRVLATTHFHELFENHMLDLSLPLSLYTMEVYQEPGRLEATFLFRVIPGKTPSSLGPACAAMASMPLHIVQRGTFLSRIFQRYEMVVPMLTEHELEMQKMYKQLVDMLLSLDLDGYLGDSAQEESKSGSTSDQHTSPFNIGGRGSNRVSNSVEGHNQDAFEGASSDWSEKAIHGKRKRSDPEEGKCIDTEKLDTDVLDRSIKELIEYAVKVSQKEREGMQEE